MFRPLILFQHIPFPRLFSADVGKYHIPPGFQPKATTDLMWSRCSASITWWIVWHFGDSNLRFHNLWPPPYLHSFLSLFLSQINTGLKLFFFPSTLKYLYLNFWTTSWIRVYVPRFYKVKTLHKIMLTYRFFSRTGFILYSVEECPRGIFCSVLLCGGLGWFRYKRLAKSIYHWIGGANFPSSGRVDTAIWMHYMDAN